MVFPPMRLKLAHSLLFFCLRTRQKTKPTKKIAKCKFYDDIHHAKLQRVFRHLKATPFLAQSKNRLPRQHHHRTVCPPNRQSLRAQKCLFLKGQAGIHLSPYAAFLCRGSYRQNRCCPLRLLGFRLAKRPPRPRPHDMGMRQILYQHLGAGRRLAWCRYPGTVGNAG